MSLRGRFILILIFVSLIPLLMPVGAYFYFKLAAPSGRLESVSDLPPLVRGSLREILALAGEAAGEDAEALAPIPPSERPPADAYPHLLLVLYGDQGPLYLHPETAAYFAERQGLFPPTDQQSQWKILAGLHELAAGEGVGSALFEAEGESGLVFYRFSGGAVFRHFRRHPFSFLALLIFLFILLPVFLSGRFLLSLRRSLSQLEQAAVQVGNHQFQAPLPPPAEGELKPLFRAFEAMRRELKENQDQKSRFLMAISHDLKTPLTSLRGFAEALEEGVVPPGEEQQRIFRILREKTDLLQQRIEELVGFARMETVDWQGRFAPFRLSEVLRPLAERFELEARLKGKAFRYEFAEWDGEPPVLGDERMVSRAAENLLENALRYSGEGGEIQMTVRREPAEAAGGSAEKESETGVENRAENRAGTGFVWALRVEDSGRGVEASEAPFVFEAFYRGNRGRNQPGFGLGLASVRGIAEAHGGAVSLAESPLGGACFLLTLPVVPENSGKGRRR